MDNINYYLKESDKIVFWSLDLLIENDLIFIGSSINPNKKMAMSVFLNKYYQNQELTGFVLKKYEQENL